MANVSNIAKRFFEIACSKYGEPADAISERELQIVHELVNLAETLAQSFFYEVCDDFSLDVADQRGELDKDDVYSYNEGSITDISLPYSFDYMKKIVDYAWTTSGKLRTERSIQHQFGNSDLTHRYIYRMKKYIASGGTRCEKIAKLKENVYQKFQNARDNANSVHDIDLKLWFINASKEANVNNFKASDTFILQFKKDYRISGRKITKFITHARSQNSEDLENEAIEFVHTVSNEMKNYSLNEILNADQSGFNKELTSTRTLTVRGEKHTPSCINSSHAISHSITIQPVISAAGNLLPQFLLIHQESKGVFGPRVVQNLFRPPNVVIQCSKSGKTTTAIHKVFLNEIIKPNVSSKKVLLLLDSWGGQTDQIHFDEAFPKPYESKLMLVPPATTPLIQPCDVYFFRQWKYLAKRITNFCMLHFTGQISMSDRNTITKLHSLIHNQLSSIKFSNMIKYAWWKSTYPISKPDKFSNVKQICFSFIYKQCQIDNCQETAFICCSHCEYKLCFTHFFITFHVHF